MDILKGNIVKNIIATEPVEITSIQDFGTDVSIEYTGVNTKQNGDIILSKDELDRLKLISQKGSFDFSGDPAKFTLYTEAERIKSAFQFDPLFAVNCSVVDPLPHQVEAVYKYMLPLPRMRFLLADDTGAGVTGFGVASFVGEVVGDAEVGLGDTGLGVTFVGDAVGCRV